MPLAAHEGSTLPCCSHDLHLELRRSQFPSLRCPVPSVPDFSRSLGSAVVVVVLVVLTVC